MNNQIRSLRTEKGLSQEELARRCGVTRQTVDVYKRQSQYGARPQAGEYPARADDAPAY